MNYIEKILDIIYPKKCIECGKICENCLCNKCKAKLKIKLEWNIDRYNNKYFNSHIYVFKYKERIREEIIKYKFRNKAYLYRIFAQSIINLNEKETLLNEYDYIIPIPISKKRRRQRGYNQSELISKELSKQIKSISFCNIIKKEIDNKAQSTLNKHDRKLNVKGVYSIDEKEIVKYKNSFNKKFLLFDDIFTTGNTVNECAKVLQEAGIKNVDIFTIAKD